MKLVRGLGVSARALFSHRVRAVLALASIAVSVGAVVVVSAIGAGATREILVETESMGTKLLVARGRFLEADDDRRAARVAVLGVRADEELFAEADAVGRTIEIRGLPFEV